MIISNPSNQNIKTLQAVNMLGQVVFEQQLNTTDNKISIPTHLATGIYVFIATTQETTISKKVVVSK